VKQISQLKSKKSSKYKTFKELSEELKKKNDHLNSMNEKLLRDNSLLTKQQSEYHKRMEELLQDSAKKISTLKASHQSQMKFVEDRLDETKSKLKQMTQRESSARLELEQLQSVNGALKRDLQKMEESIECKVCYENRIDTVFRPCNHQAFCARCAVGMRICAVCRTPITEAIKVFPNWK
jgi:chromosome segregation ATPase